MTTSRRLFKLVLNTIAVTIGVTALAPCASATTVAATDTATSPSASGQPAVDPQSASFIGPRRGWTWGPGPAWLAHARGAGVLARTVDGGRRWTVVPTPGINYAQTGDPGGKHSGESGVRFLGRHRGFLFGSALYVTGDGGAKWHRVKTPGDIVDLEVGGDHAYALVLGCVNRNRCSGAHLYSVSRTARMTRINVIGQVSGSTDLVVRGRTVYLLAPSPSRGHTLEPATLWVSRDGRSWQRRSAPCRWNGADAGALGAWSASGLALACGSEPGAGNQQKSFYVSTDAGRRWRSAGQIPGARGLHGMSPGYIADLAAASQRHWVLAEGRGALLVTRNGGRSWHAARSTGHRDVEGWGYVAFTSASSAVAVPWTLNGSVLALTDDGGRRWHEVAFPTARS